MQDRIHKILVHSCDYKQLTTNWSYKVKYLLKHDRLSHFSADIVRMSADDAGTEPMEPADDELNTSTAETAAGPEHVEEEKVPPFLESAEPVAHSGDKECWSKMTVAQLREELTERGLSIVGRRKDVLVARLVASPLFSTLANPRLSRLA